MKKLFLSAALLTFTISGFASAAQSLSGDYVLRDNSCRAYNEVGAIININANATHIAVGEVVFNVPNVGPRAIKAATTYLVGARALPALGGGVVREIGQYSANGDFTYLSSDIGTRDNQMSIYLEIKKTSTGVNIYDRQQDTVCKLDLVK